MSKRIENIERCLVIDGKSFLAVIPARGGSKRLPRKNLLDLSGKPLIAWTIEAAKNSKYLDDIVVTTDDQDISEVSQRLGVNVLLRPDELATDAASSVDVVIHAVIAQEVHYDFIILLQPTSPLRNADHIDDAIELLQQKSANAVISVCESEHSPLWANSLPSDGCMNNFIREEMKNKRSQELPIYYRLNGAIYIVNASLLQSERTFFLKEKCFAYQMDKSVSQDIDDYYDFQVTTLIHRTRDLNNS